MPRSTSADQTVTVGIKFVSDFSDAKKNDADYLASLGGVSAKFSKQWEEAVSKTVASQTAGSRKIADTHKETEQEKVMVSQSALKKIQEAEEVSARFLQRLSKENVSKLVEHQFEYQNKQKTILGLIRAEKDKHLKSEFQAERDHIARITRLYDTELRTRLEVNKLGFGSKVGLLGVGRELLQTIGGGGSISMLGEFANLQRTLAPVKSLLVDTSKASDGLTSSFASLGLKLLNPTTVALAAFSLGLREAVKAGMPFETSMASLSARTGLAGEQLKALQADVLEFSDKFHEEGPKAADAFKKTIAAFGPNIAHDKATVDSLTDSMGLLTKAMGPDGDLSTSITVTSTLMNQFGLNVGTGSEKAENARKIIEVLAATSKQSGVDIQSLSTSMGSAGEIAHQYGLTIEQTAGAVLLLSKNGMDGGIQFRQFIENLSTGTPEAEKALDKLGLKYYQINPELVGFNKSLEVLKTRVEQIKDPIERHLLLQEIFSKRSVVAAEVLLQQSDKFKELTQSVTDQNVVTGMAATNMDTLAEKVKDVKIEAETFAIKLYEKATPALKEFVGFARSTIHELEGIYALMTSIGGAADSSEAQLNKNKNVFAASQHQQPVDFTTIGMSDSAKALFNQHGAGGDWNSEADSQREALEAAKRNQDKKDAAERAKAAKQAAQAAAAARREAFDKEQQEIRDQAAERMATWLASAKHTDDEINLKRLTSEEQAAKSIYDLSVKYNQKSGSEHEAWVNKQLELDKFRNDQTKKRLEEQRAAFKLFASDAFEFDRIAYERELKTLDDNLDNRKGSWRSYQEDVLKLNIQYAEKNLSVAKTLAYLGIADQKAVADAEEQLHRARHALSLSSNEKQDKVDRAAIDEEERALKEREQTLKDFVNIGLAPITTELERQIGAWTKWSNVAIKAVGALADKLISKESVRLVDKIDDWIFGDDKKKLENKKKGLDALPSGGGGMDTDNPNGEIVPVGSGFLAVLHRGEVVVPKTQLPLLGGPGLPVNLEGEGGGGIIAGAPAPKRTDRAEMVRRRLLEIQKYDNLFVEKNTGTPEDQKQKLLESTAVGHALLLTNQNISNLLKQGLSDQEAIKQLIESGGAVRDVISEHIGRNAITTLAALPAAGLAAGGGGLLTSALGTTGLSALGTNAFGMAATNVVAKEGAGLTLGKKYFNPEAYDSASNAITSAAGGEMISQHFGDLLVHGIKHVAPELGEIIGEHLVHHVSEYTIDQGVEAVKGSESTPMNISALRAMPAHALLKDFTGNPANQVGISPDLRAQQQDYERRKQQQQAVMQSSLAQTQDDGSSGSTPSTPNAPSDSKDVQKAIGYAAAGLSTLGSALADSKKGNKKGVIKDLLVGGASLAANALIPGSGVLVSALGNLFSGGGHVVGPGGPTDDMIHARLSAGEYVVKASAVKAIGLNNLDYMNNRYADGGLVHNFSPLPDVHQPLFNSNSTEQTGAHFDRLGSRLESAIREQKIVAETNPYDNRRADHQYTNAKKGARL